MGPSLTRLFDTDGARGSWEIVEKLGPIGIGTKWILSIIGVFTLMSTLIRTATTIMYLGNRKFWDEVDDSKQNDTDNLRSGRGFDRVFSILKPLLPNLKQISDAGSSQFNLTEEDTMFTYICKSAGPTIVIIIFATLCYNGILFQIYANVADGAVAVANHMKDLQIAKTVDALIEAEKDYSFTLGADGTNKGIKLQSLSKTVYANAVSQAGTIDKGTKAGMGSFIEQKMSSDVASWAEKVGEAFPDVAKYLTDSRAANNQNASVWDAIEVKVSPTSAANKDKVGSKSAVFTQSDIVGLQIGGPGEDAYLFTVYSKIPQKSSFTVTK